jgi:hypothetical protein
VYQRFIPLMGKLSRVLLTAKCDVPNITPGQALGRVLSSGQRGEEAVHHRPGHLVGDLAGRPAGHAWADGGPLGSQVCWPDGSPTQMTAGLPGVVGGISALFQSPGGPRLPKIPLLRSPLK